MRIGQLAKVTSTPVSTIRYYELVGILQFASRQSGNQRVYGDADVQRLNFVRRIREFGFSLEKVRVLLGLLDNPRGSCARTREVASWHLTEVRERIEELAALERTLASLIVRCDQDLIQGEPQSCVLLENLASGASLGVSQNDDER